MKTFVKDKDNYKITVAANYPNNPKLVKQEILLDKEDSDETQILVFDNDDTEILNSPKISRAITLFSSSQFRIASILL